MKLKRLIRSAPYIGDFLGGSMLEDRAAPAPYVPSDPVWAFFSSFILTLLLISLAAGLLYVDKSAREAAGIYEYKDMEAGAVRLIEALSALGRDIGWIFPYFIIAVELILLLCRLFSAAAEAVL